MRGESSTSDPILCAHLLRRVDEKLIDLLSSLTPSEWNLQTIAPLWRVPRRRSAPARHRATQTFHGSGFLLCGSGKHPVARRPNHSGKSSEPGRGDRLSSPEPQGSDRDDERDL